MERFLRTLCAVLLLTSGKVQTVLQSPEAECSDKHLKSNLKKKDLYHKGYEEWTDNHEL